MKDTEDTFVNNLNKFTVHKALVGDYLKVSSHNHNQGMGHLKEDFGTTKTGCFQTVWDNNKGSLVLKGNIPFNSSSSSMRIPTFVCQ